MIGIYYEIPDGSPMEELSALKGELAKLEGFREAAREEQRKRRAPDLILELRRIEARMATVRVEIFRVEGNAIRVVSSREPCPDCQRMMPRGTRIRERCPLKRTGGEPMPRAKKPAAKAAPPSKEGTVVQYVLQGGEEIDAVIDADGKPCCPTCDRRLPKQKMLSPKEVATYEAREAKLKARLLEEHRHILGMANKTRAKLGKDPITLDEVLQEAAK